MKQKSFRSVLGWTQSTDFPGTTGGAQANNGGNTCNDAFVAKFDESLAATACLLTLKVVGYGTVTSSPSGINCNANCCCATCSVIFSCGTPVTLSATPTTFIGWNGACSGADVCKITMNTEKTVTASFTSTDPVTTLITLYYQYILGRIPDPAGLAYYQDAIAKAQAQGDAKPAFRQMSSNFLNSPEYVNRKTSDTEYITTLYKTFLQRDPESAGLQFYLNRLSQGEARNNFITDFTNSSEFTAFMKSLGF